MGLLEIIKRNIWVLEDDIQTPYRKIVSLILKTMGVSAVIIGIYFFFLAFETQNKYFELQNKYFELRDNYEFMRQNNNIGEETISSIRSADLALLQLETEQISYEITLFCLSGIGWLLLGVFISGTLYIRYMSFVLPDRIYHRCFATEEEKKKMRS
ncbi:MAG: hypothetical protein AAB516_01150 [Patescibacteria group bacterium]